MRKASFVLIALAAAAAAAAQDAPSQQPYSAPLALEPGASHYRFSLPAAAYRGNGRRDFADLRVFNAAGEPVPYAFAVREMQPAAPVLQKLNLFPLHGDRENGLAAAKVSVQRTAQGSVVNVSVSDAVPAARRRLIGYLVDASELKAPQEALLFTWQAREGFSGRARVEGSDDLKSWRVLASGAPILSLEHAGARLERNRVELGGARASYLRVSFEAVDPAFALKEASVELRAASAEPAREWLSLQAVPGKIAGELLLDTAGHYPVDRIKFILPQPNTVARVHLSTRDRADDGWRSAASATLYRLAREGGEISNPEVRTAVNADRYWRILVEQKGGGFGSGEVRVELGWVPHQIVFAARGAGPFRLAYGNKLAKPGASALSVVLPQDEKLAPAAASVGEVSASAAPAPSIFADPGRFLRSLSEHGELKKWTLWAALLAGVLLLGWMALRLLRDLGKTPPDRKGV